MQEKLREISIIKQRILTFLDFMGISKNAFYVKTGISNGVLSQKGGISEENILRFLSIFSEISPEWLLTGEGEMLKKEAKFVTTAENFDPNKPHDKHLIPFFDDVMTIGGTNSIAAVVDGNMPTNEWLDAGDWFNNATAAIRHYGDSMVEYPSGCILVLRRVEDVRQIVWGTNYCIETDEFRITKRLQTGPTPDTIVAYSSNTATHPDGRLIHEPLTIPTANIRALWQILGYVVKTYSSGAVFVK